MVSTGICAAERTPQLRARCRTRKTNAFPDTTMVTSRSLRSTEGWPSWATRRAQLTRDRLVGTEFAVDDLELLVGRIAMAPRAPEAELNEARAYVMSYVWPGGQTGHCELDLSRLFALGIDGLCREIRNRSKTNPERGETYRTFLLALEGFSRFAENAAAAAESAMTSASPARHAELREMADSCRRISREPPASFRDAIQLVWLADLAVSHADDAGLVVPGHLDRSLWPFYERDTASGVLTRDDALLLIECLYILINEYIPDGLAMSLMVGGRDAAGNDVTNELSYLCLEALRRTRMIYPTVGICWHEGTPQPLVDLAIDLIAEGCTTPAFFGDETIQRGLRNLAVPSADACHYINSTCVEITPVGGSNVWVASPYFPVCSFLLDEITAQVENDTPAQTFESFLANYRARLAEHVKQAAEEQNRLRKQRRLTGGKPLQSVFTRDCINRGRDIDDGGAIYNWVECSFVGLPNLADSLLVVREEVYARKRLSLAELKAALDVDFFGYEPLRQRLLNGHPKYGQGNPDVDALFAQLLAICVEACVSQRMFPDESPYVPGAFCWIMHEALGRQCGATPDGRRAGFPFADGCGPAQGREKYGPTAAVLSTTSWDHAHLIGGAAYNMKFNECLFTTGEARDRLRNLVTTFLRRGGFEAQINMVSLETLKKARSNPEAYADLIVRIGGYCDYFTRLSPEMQAEIMLRTEFAHDG